MSFNHMELRLMKQVTGVIWRYRATRCTTAWRLPIEIALFEKLLKVRNFEKMVKIKTHGRNSQTFHDTTQVATSGRATALQFLLATTVDDFP